MIDATGMTSSLAASLPGFTLLLNGLSSLLGLWLTIIAVFKFVEVGRHGDQPGGVRWINPAMYLLCGIALWNFAGSVNAMLHSFFGESTSVNTLMSYDGSSSSLPSQTSEMLKIIIMFLRLYGYFTYIRAWLTFKKIGSGNNASDEPFKTGLVRLFAGVFLINLVATVNAISTTFGYGNVL